MQIETRHVLNQSDDGQYARFDHLKLQRQRMEHIYEVIKDLNFKNRELAKQNAELILQTGADRYYQRLYEQILTQKKLLIEKNTVLHTDLDKQRETIMHQDVIINSLKQQLYSNRNDKGNSKSHFDSSRCEHKRNRKQNEHQILEQEYLIIKAQYEDLQVEYSKLYQQLYAKDKQNSLEVPGRIYTSLKFKQPAQNNLLVENHKKQYTANEAKVPEESKLRQKYDKLKQAYKELQLQVKKLSQQTAQLKERQQQCISLIQLMKEKKTKICRCHVNKFEKQISSKTIESIKVKQQK